RICRPPLNDHRNARPSGCLSPAVLRLPSSNQPSACPVFPWLLIRHQSAEKRPPGRQKMLPWLLPPGLEIVATDCLAIAHVAEVAEHGRVDRVGEGMNGSVRKNHVKTSRMGGTEKLEASAGADVIRSR